MTKPEGPRELPKPIVHVRYVDSDGTICRASTVGWPLPGSPVVLVVGGRGIRLLQASYSDEHLPGTWHFPPED